MKTIGLIGGMSWESSAVYYKLINRSIKQKLGGLHSAKIVMVSLDFAEIEKLQHSNDWDGLNQHMVNAAQQLEKAGANFIVLCTNTMHLCSAEIEKHTTIPFLHIARATGEQIKAKKLKKIALLGTKFTMEKDFYKGILETEFGVEVITPNASERTLIHDIIYQELVLGVITKESKITYQNIIKKLEQNGAEGVILGCTEIPLLITESDVDISIFDTTQIHADSAVIQSLS